MTTRQHRDASPDGVPAEQAIAETRAWVRRAVIGLNLCPFASAVDVKDQIRYVHSDATDAETLLATLVVELQRLADTDPELVDTTLVIHPRVLADFQDFNDFLELADAALDELELDGVLQVASFHPRFQFADTDPDDITNATNRSPYPTLHLLREDSVDRAVAAFPDAEAIFERNMATLEALGAEGWAALQQSWEDDAAAESGLIADPGASTHRPTSQPGHGAHSGMVPPTTSSAIGSLLIVDDNIVQRMQVVALCRELGIEMIYEAASGAEALELLSLLVLPPDVAIVDLEMPVMDGVELIELMHERGL